MRKKIRPTISGELFSDMKEATKDINRISFILWTDQDGNDLPLRDDYKVPASMMRELANLVDSRCPVISRKELGNKKLYCADGSEMEINLMPKTWETLGVCVSRISEFDLSNKWDASKIGKKTATVAGFASDTLDSPGKRSTKDSWQTGG